MSFWLVVSHGAPHQSRVLGLSSCDALKVSGCWHSEAIRERHPQGVHRYNSIYRRVTFGVSTQQNASVLAVGVRLACTYTQCCFSSSWMRLHVPVYTYCGCDVSCCGPSLGTVGQLQCHPVRRRVKAPCALINACSARKLNPK